VTDKDGHLPFEGAAADTYNEVRAMLMVRVRDNKVQCVRSELSLRPGAALMRVYCLRLLQANVIPPSWGRDGRR